MFSLLRPMFTDIMPDETDYEEVFDRFEYFSSLLYNHAAEKSPKPYPVPGPIGRFLWRNRDWSAARTVMKDIEAEVQKVGGNWQPLKEGLFDGSIDSFRLAKKSIDDFLAKYSR